MLPAHGYPGQKKYPDPYWALWHRLGEPEKEFGLFPGAILMTTNCLLEPAESYKARIFTTVR